MKSGYRLTELGVIPEEWEVVRLGDLGTVVRGGSPRPAGDPRYFNGNFIPWLTVGSLTNIPSNQIFAASTATMLTEEGEKRSRTLQHGTLVIVNSGAKTLGVSKILSITCCANDGIAALVNQRSGDKRFLCYFLNSQINRLREVVAAGNDQLNLNTRRIALITVPFPKESEQRAISEALSDVDALLDGLDRLITKKRYLKLAAMQQLLSGSIRLADFRGEWVAVCLSDVADRTAGFWGSKSADESRPRLVGVIRAGDISANGELTATAPRFYSDAEYAKAVCRLGDVVLTGSGSVGKVWWCDGRCDIAASNFVRLLRPIAKRVDGKFLAQLLRSEAIQRLMSEHIATGVMANLGSSFFNTPWIRLPGIEEQYAIATVLSDMDAELSALEQRRDKTHSLKQGLLQELLTGRTRLV